MLVCLEIDTQPEKAKNDSEMMMEKEEHTRYYQVMSRLFTQCGYRNVELFYKHRNFYVEGTSRKGESKNYYSE